MFTPAPAALPVVGVANQHLYRRHRPEQTALHPVIEGNLTPFLEYLHERDAALPRFVTDEFKDYLRCGRQEYGFIRVKCEGCPPRAPGGILLQTARLLPVVWRASDDRDLGTPRQFALGTA